MLRSSRGWTRSRRGTEFSTAMCRGLVSHGLTGKLPGVGSDGWWWAGAIPPEQMGTNCCAWLVGQVFSGIMFGLSEAGGRRQVPFSFTQRSLSAYLPSCLHVAHQISFRPLHGHHHAMLAHHRACFCLTLDTWSHSASLNMVITAIVCFESQSPVFFFVSIQPRGAIRWCSSWWSWLKKWWAAKLEDGHQSMWQCDSQKKLCGWRKIYDAVGMMLAERFTAGASLLSKSVPLLHLGGKLVVFVSRLEETKTGFEMHQAIHFAFVGLLEIFWFLAFRSPMHIWVLQRQDQQEVRDMTQGQR